MIVLACVVMFLWAIAVVAIANHRSNSPAARSVEHNELPLPMIRSHRRPK